MEKEVERANTYWIDPSTNLEIEEISRWSAGSDGLQRKGVMQTSRIYVPISNQPPPAFEDAWLLLRIRSINLLCWTNISLSWTSNNMSLNERYPSGFIFLLYILTAGLFIFFSFVISEDGHARR